MTRDTLSVHSLQGVQVFRCFLLSTTDGEDRAMLFLSLLATYLINQFE